MNNPVSIAIKTKPKLGFAGVGWIGKNRLNAIRKHQAGEILAIADPDDSAVKCVLNETDGAVQYGSFEGMLESDVEGVVIASPSALHAEQSVKALKKGKAVFCQKPLGRNETETAHVVETARKRNLLLRVDLSYRYTEAVKQVRKVIQSGEIGRIYGVNLIFHNAFGPDKSWYYDPQKSGGGCVMDLGIHLIDLLFWILNEPQISNMNSRLFCRGKRMESQLNEVEDYAAAQFTLNDETAVQLACSWNLPAGKDAVLQAVFYGENGGVAFRNTEGSFYHFLAEKYNGTSTEILAEPPDDWEGRAAVVWSEKLAAGNEFDPDAETCVKVARALDLIYQNSRQ